MQNGRHFPDDISKFITNENIWILIKIWLKIVPKGQLMILQLWFR